MYKRLVELLGITLLSLGFGFYLGYPFGLMMAGVLVLIFW